MKNYIIGLLLMAFSFSVSAQEVWHTDLDKAAAISTKTKKPLLLFFTGSDWCGWCIKLQKEVLHTPEFDAWAKENVVLLELDFPRRVKLDPKMAQQNAELQQAFKVRGYPTVWIVDLVPGANKVNFSALGSTGYVAGGPTAWLAGANRILQNKTKG